MADMIFIPKTCQWIEDDNGKCRLPTLRGKSYCEEHYLQAYRTSTTADIDRMAAKELTKLKTIKEHETIDPEE